MMETTSVTIGLTAVILAVTDEVPRVLVVRRMRHELATPAQLGTAGEPADSLDALPFGPFEPRHHRTLEQGLRRWVEEQTGLNLRYVEQLYTFGNRYRDTREILGGGRLVSVAYLALTNEAPVAGSGEARWADWYGFLPWEDWREGPPALVDAVIRPALRRWIKRGGQALRHDREHRAEVCFGLSPNVPFDRVRTLERHELLYEAGLVPEAHSDLRLRQRAGGESPSELDPESAEVARLLGPAMALDNRRILATALGRIRGKLAYRPVVFELLPEQFTLLKVQRVVEALAGLRLHKQNFRRMLLAGELVEPTGRADHSGRGRPAELYRFRSEVIRERSAVGIGLPTARAAE
ncbi:MAG TPA: hypothetical protein VE631_09580 [Alphaproteobacteria bacterium]|nr:hypothetical protein [Alphaproteobacteria bacterium]